MRTIEQIIETIEECQHRNRLIQEDIVYLEQHSSELRRLVGIPDILMAAKVNQWKLERARADLRKLEAQL